MDGDGAFEAFLSVADAGLWKPARETYAFALRSCSVDAADAMLVAAHPWDTDGAGRAGLTTAWVNRAGGGFPGYCQAPDLEASSLDDLAAQLT